jgi:hypothetical protein
MPDVLLRMPDVVGNPLFLQMSIGGGTLYGSLPGRSLRKDTGDDVVRESRR